MADIFLSYSRDDSLAMEVIRDNLRRLGVNVWVDIEHLEPGTPQWSRAVKQAIQQVDGLIVLCSPAAESSEWVNREVYLAKAVGKPILPVLISGTELESIPADIIGSQYINLLGRADRHQGFRALVRWLVDAFGWEAPDYEFEPGGSAGDLPVIQVINISGHVEGTIISVAGDVSGEMNVAGGDISRAQAVIASETGPPPRPSRTAGTGFSVLPTWIWGVGGGIILVGVVGLLVLNGILKGSTGIQSEPTRSPVLALAEQGVAQNSEWEPYTEVFDGVEMALVPAGCFQMGSTASEQATTLEMCKEEGVVGCEASWFEREGPVAEICFDQPFWIDVTEVTNGQYGSWGQWSGDNLPRETVTWFEAEGYCDRRGARLPTEAEWEYAARGPDRLMFPWSNTFDGGMVNYCDTNCTENYWADQTVDDGYEYTAPVGSYPNGASWVGALDMAGNVWEWVSSLSVAYPYDPSDGREVNASQFVTGMRVVRGGAWNYVGYFSRTNYRTEALPTGELFDLGFRCARSYTP